MERLWTPWRMRYVANDEQTPKPGCIFCTKPADNDDVDNLILYRGQYSFAIMNLYPYNTGHVMVVPYEHVADVSSLDGSPTSELFGLVSWITAAQKRTLRCHGFNIGLNLGSVAGAGIAEHLHVHIVPRWEGDANFMPILANTMVLPELVSVTYAKLRGEMEVSALCARNTDVVPQGGAIIYLPDSGKIALRRARDGSIIFPKGHIEAGEAAWQTAVREVAEETGLLAEVAGWGGILSYHDGRNEKRIAHFVVTAQTGPNFESHLGKDTLLYTPEEAREALTFDASRDLLDQALKHYEDLFKSRS